MVSDSHAQASCTVSPPGPWVTAERPQEPAAKQPEIQTQGAKGSGCGAAASHRGWQGRSGGCWQEGVGMVLREREIKKEKEEAAGYLKVSPA